MPNEVKLTGWICPKCGRGLAPWVRACDCLDYDCKFESIWSDIQTWRIHGARQQLNFIDKIVEPPAPAPAPAFTPDYWRQRGFRFEKRFPGEYDVWRHPGTLQHLRLYDDGSQWLQDAQTGEYKLVEQGEPPAHAPDCAVALNARHACSCGKSNKNKGG